MDNELGKYLRELRGQRSLREVSALSKGRISHNYIRDSEKGVTGRGNEFTPSPEKLKVFSEVYHVSYNKLMSLAGYTGETPEWASEEDIIELKDLIDNNVNMSYGGENLTEAEKQRVRDIITGLFWEKAQKRKEGGGNDRTRGKN